MSRTAKDILIEQRDKLKGDCEFLARQIPVLAQRLEDMKQTLNDNIKSIHSIECALEIVGAPAFSLKIDESDNFPCGTWPKPAQTVDGCKFHSSPDIPKHLKIETQGYFG